MYTVAQPENMYYKINLQTSKREIIGDEYTMFLREFNDYFVCNKGGNPYAVTSYSTSDKFEELALNSRDKKRKMVKCKDILGKHYLVWRGDYEMRTVMYCDNLNRIIDPRNYLDKIVELKTIPSKVDYSKCYWTEPEWARKWKNRQRTKSCSGCTWRRQYFHNMTQARKMEAMLKNDPEYRAYCKEYHLSANVLDHTDIPHSWWDEKGRRTEGNWKSQSRADRQYNSHKRAKDSKTIRRYRFYEEFSNEEIELMLEEDFLNVG